MNEYFTTYVEIFKEIKPPITYYEIRKKLEMKCAMSKIDPQ